MRPLRAAPRPSRLAAGTALAATLLAGGCEMPRFEGPQIQSPPPAFTLNANAELERRIFPDLAIVHHDAWVEASWGNFSGIYINGHPGRLTIEQIEGARTAALATYDVPVEATELEPLRIDGQAAWGWTELWRPPGEGLKWVAYRAVIPYDTVTFAVEFLAGDPGLKQRPDSLRAIVASFGIGRTEWNVPLLALMAGALLLVVGTVRSRMQAQAARARSIPLVKIPKPPEQPAAEDRGEPASPEPTRPAAPPPAARRRQEPTR